MALGKWAVGPLLVLMVLAQAACKKDDGPDGSDNGNNPFGCERIVTDMVLEKGTYRINCLIYLSDTAKLTIAPGTRFEMGSEGGFVLEGGTIIAVGTAAEPIVFTGQKTEPGAWISMDVLHNTPNVFEHCIFEYGGKGPRSMVRLGGDDNGVGRAMFRNCTFRYGAKNGMFVNVHSLLDSFTNNRFEGNTEYPIRLAFTNVRQLLPGNTYTGNGIQMVEVHNGGGLPQMSSGTMVFNNIGIPYYIHPNCSLLRFVSDIEVLAGVELVMGKDAAFHLHTASAFMCLGTQTDRVTIRGLEDEIGYWDGIVINGSYSSTNTFTYTDISNGGSGKSDTLAHRPGTIASPLSPQGDNTHIIFKRAYPF